MKPGQAISTQLGLGLFKKKVIPSIIWIRYRLPLPLFLLIVSSGSFGQKLTHSVSIPFTLTIYNNISIKAVLNEIDTVNLMFHTAANSMTLTEEAVSKLSSLRFTSNTDSIKSWGGQANSSRLSVNNRLSIGKLNFDSIAIWENVNSGQFTDGKFGLNLFEGWNVEINFDLRLINLAKKIRKKKLKDYSECVVINEDGLLFLEASCKVNDSIYTNRFLIHSGYAGALLLDDQFATDHQLGKILRITGENSLTDSYGNIVKTKQAILPVLQIQVLSLTELPVGFFEGSIGRQTMSVLGGDVLKRFNIIIAADRRKIYLKPNTLFETAYRKT